MAFRVLPGSVVHVEFGEVVSGLGFSDHVPCSKPDIAGDSASRIGRDGDEG